MKFHYIPALVAVSVFAAASSVSAIGIDIASNYGTWTNGSNGGSGFLAWSFSNNNNDTSIFAGTFLGSSTAGAGDINTGGQAFALYANPSNAFVTASRAFSTALGTGETFTFDLALNFDNGNKGFNLYAGSQGGILNFNVGSGGSVSSANAILNPGPGAGYNYGGNDAVLSVSISKTSTSALAFSISRTSSSGNQGVLFSGTVSGITEDVTGFQFYNSGTVDGSAQNNLYFNNLAVVPEPASATLMLLGLGACLARRRR